MRERDIVTGSHLLSVLGTVIFKWTFITIIIQFDKFARVPPHLNRLIEIFMI